MSIMVGESWGSCSRILQLADTRSKDAQALQDLSQQVKVAA